MPGVRYGLSVTVETRLDKTYVIADGELDMSNVSVFIDALGTIDPEAQAGVVVEIRTLDFLGACGINSIVLTAARLAMRGCPLMISGASPMIRRSLIATGLASLLTRPDVLSEPELRAS